MQTSAPSSSQNSVVFDEETVNNLLEEEEEARSITISDDLSFYSLPQSESEEDTSNQENHHHQEEEEEDEETISMADGSKSFRYEVNTPAITTRARSVCTSFRYVGDEPSLRVTKKIAFVLDDDKIEGIQFIIQYDS